MRRRRRLRARNRHQYRRLLSFVCLRDAAQPAGKAEQREEVRTVSTLLVVRGEGGGVGDGLR